jgi:hypothetical protein
MRLPAYLEVGAHGWSAAYVFRFPGVYTVGPSAAYVLRTLAAEIEWEIERLARSGRPVARLGSEAVSALEIVETERVASTFDLRCGVSPVLFAYELRPTTDADVELALDRFALAVEEIDRAADSPFARLVESRWDEIAKPGVLTPGQRVRAAADQACWLLSRLGTAVEPITVEEPRARLAAAHALVESRLRNLLPGDRERHSVLAGEPWTARKVLRRLVCSARLVPAPWSRSIRP